MARHSVIAAVLLSVLVFALSSPRSSKSEQLAVTADLSLLSSWASRRDSERKWSDQGSTMEAMVRRGPLRQMEVAYDAALEHTELDETSPNVLIIMLESVGTQHLGYSGYVRDVTPHLDELAAESLSFRNARTTATHSNYAQMAVLSSLFPRRYSGLDTYRRLDYPRVLWHDLLLDLGYSTSTISSQDERWQGMIRFESTRDEHPILHSGNYEGQTQIMGSERVVPDEVTARRAVRWMSRQSQPFGIYVNFQSTHFPYVVPKHVEKKYLPDRPTRGKFHYLKYPREERSVVVNRYDNALSYVDAQIGYIIDNLRKLDLLDSTIVVLTSDHGELFWQHDMVTHGRSLFDAEARVPLLIRYPERVHAGTDERAVSTLDVLPTLAGLLDLPTHPSFQGVDLLGEAYDSRRPVFLNIQGMRSREAVICGRYKFSRGPTGKKPALFNLERDPHELHNLIAEQPSRAEALERFLAAHMRAQMAYYRPNDDHLRQARFAPRFGQCPELDTHFEPSSQSQPKSASVPRPATDALN